MDTIFKSNTCPSCSVLASMLQGKRVAVTWRNIDVDPSARAALLATGYAAVPTAIIDGRAHVGMQPILNALRQKYGNF